MRVRFDKLYDDVKEPSYSHIGDAGADIYMYKDTVIAHGKNVIPLGFTCVLPDGYAGFLSLRSSWMAEGIICNMTPFDPSYSGEWNLIVYNTGDEFVIPRGDRICQLLVMPIVQCQFISSNEYNNNQRHSGGQGSTGK